ncbi:amino acid adenylation domain-containing protein [Phytohabitans sp. LJ34]|uniref:amino acid adenylation domain-containing protein n=1 Tax=Phytohabitans sp. LJ34 TaxID=3452217 RepID=UPI003F8C2BD2
MPGHHHAPLSFAQQRLWFLDQLTPGSAEYVVPFGFRVSGGLDIGALESAFTGLVERHELLRTRFVAGEDGLPRQVVGAPWPVTVTVTDLDERAAGALVDVEAHTPFDLASGRLLRVTVIRLAPGEHILLLCVHHIAVDEWSLRTLVRDLSELYTAAAQDRVADLPRLPVQYADFAVWQRASPDDEVQRRQRGYWREQLSGLEPIDLPTDRPRPAVRSGQGATWRFAVPAGVAAQLRGIAQRARVTMFMLVMAAFQLFLSRYSGRDDIAVGVPTAGRDRPEVEDLVGFFVNTLVMRTDLSGDPTFLELLRRVRETALDAYDNQDLPFERLIEDLAPDRALSHHALFQVFFVLRDTMDDEGWKIPGLAIERFHVPDRTAKFDLTLLAVPSATGLDCQLEYSIDLFDQATIARMAGHLTTLLSGIAADPERRVSALELLPADERGRLLVEWNDTGLDVPLGGIPDLFAAHVAATPDAVALVDGDQTLTYRQLDARANQLAHHLRAHGVGPEVLVAVGLPRGADMIMAALAVLKAGGGYVPLDPDHPADRLAFMLRDCAAPILLTYRRTGLRNTGGQTVFLDADPHGFAAGPDTDPHRVTTPRDTAFVIYTSGSTGRPKGVVVEVGAVTNFLAAARQILRAAPTDRVLFATAFSFDVATIEIFVPLTVGARIVVADHDTVRSPTDLANLIVDHKVSLVCATPSQWRQLVAALPFRIDNLKAVTAGEALTADLARRLVDVAGYVVNGYGPTETTVLSAYHVVGPTHPTAIGRPIANTRTFVVDRAGNPVPVGVSGELWIGGDGVARGYLDRPELTAERFVPSPFPEYPGERLYRTGDLVRWLPDGHLEYLGRADRQVKVRGVRIEPGEVETVLLGHDSVVSCAVVAHGDRLAAYCVLAAPATVHDLRAWCARTLPEHMVPNAFVFLDALPLNPNGKVDWAALPAPDSSRPELSTEFAAARTDVEEAVARIWAQVLGLAQVGIHDNFFALGGHSLLAIRAVAGITKQLGAAVTVRDVFATPTVAGLAAKVEAWTGEAAPAMTARSAKDLPLSFGQRRLWFLDQLTPHSADYVVCVGLRVTGDLRVTALESAFSALVSRHEVLRTRFVAGPALEPRQVVEEPWPVAATIVDLTAVAGGANRERAADEAIGAEAHRPFDLAAGHLLRVSVVHLAQDEHLVLVCMHHIVTDAWSLGVLARELRELYAAAVEDRSADLPALPVQYGDFTMWQREWLPVVSAKQLSFWRSALDGLRPLDLPTDRPRPAARSGRGAAYLFTVPDGIVSGLRDIARGQDASLFMVVLAAFQLLLSHWCRQDDVAVGVVSAGRSRPEVQHLIGLFVDTVVIRCDLAGDPAFPEILRRVKAATLDAFDNQHLPFERVVEHLAPERDLSRQPLFQVLFSMHTATGEGWTLPGLAVEQFHVPSHTAKFDLSVVLTERDGGDLAGHLTYSTDLFDEGTIDRLVARFGTLLAAVVADPRRQVTAVEVVPAAERSQLERWSGTAAGHADDKCLHQLVEEQARVRPGAVAVVSGTERLTYAQLNAAANRLAHHLRARGVGPDIPVGVHLHRGLDMVVALLGVLKAGGAYLPLDPSYPAERLAFMLRDSAAELVVTRDDLAGRLPDHAGQMVLLDTDAAALDTCPATDPPPGAGPDHLAYVIYTSGSTGVPKGVLTPHRAVVNFLRYIHGLADVTPSDVVGQAATFSFDISVFECWGALTAGATMVVIPTEVLVDPDRLRAAFDAYGVTVMRIGAVLLNSHLSARPRLLAGLKTVCYGGEAVPRAVVDGILATPHAPGQLIHWYGPTETTVISTCHVVGSAGTGAVMPIGRPIADTQLYIVDVRGQLAPIGTPGELWIGGAGVARGYLGRPELTAERFVPNPFSTVPGARVYRTGDLVRWLPDGTLEFVGRTDHQVKVRGHRVEPAEVEAALTAHPAVRQAVVTARDDSLVAYLVADDEHRRSEGERALLEEWRSKWDSAYRSPGAGAGYAIWTSSATGEPIPEAEMREWHHSTAERILALRPKRVLEIGVGTGLILSSVAPLCESYTGTDISPAAIETLRTGLGEDLVDRVDLRVRPADVLDDIPPRSFDVVILNSVVQYFPSLDYLLQVLRGALACLSPGGAVFVGDVRNLRLLRCMRTAVELRRHGTAREVTAGVDAALRLETELLLDPDFFAALPEHLDGVAACEVRVKAGGYDNELSRYRYDVVIRTSAAGDPAVPQIRWSPQDTVDSVEARLRTETRGLQLLSVPNRRVIADHRAMCVVDSGGDIAEALRVSRGRPDAPALEEFQRLADRTGHDMAATWSANADDGALDILFSKASTAQAALYRTDPPSLDLARYANSPARSSGDGDLLLSVRRHVAGRLPDFMVPSSMMLLAELPLTPNGKVDRRALPEPEHQAVRAGREPRTATEELLCEVFAEILGLPTISIDSDFFESGGHSLLATRIAARVRSRLGVPLSIRTLFEAPTVALLAESLDHSGTTARSMRPRRDRQP